MLLLVKYEVKSYMHIFFTVKNTLVLLLIWYRLYVLFENRHNILASREALDEIVRQSASTNLALNPRHHNTDAPRIRCNKDTSREERGGRIEPAVLVQYKRRHDRSQHDVVQMQHEKVLGSPGMKTRNLPTRASETDLVSKCVLAKESSPRV